MDYFECECCGLLGCCYDNSTLEDKECVFCKTQGCSEGKYVKISKNTFKILTDTQG
jgi:hypothetical protein